MPGSIAVVAWNAISPCGAYPVQVGRPPPYPSLRPRDTPTELQIQYSQRLVLICANDQ